MHTFHSCVTANRLHAYILVMYLYGSISIMGREIGCINSCSEINSSFICIVYKHECYLHLINKHYRYTGPHTLARPSEIQDLNHEALIKSDLVDYSSTKYFTICVVCNRPVYTSQNVTQYRIQLNEIY